MPLRPCQHGGRPGVKWGEHGACYPYEPGVPASKAAAERKALAQAAAIRARTDARPRRPVREPRAAMARLQRLYDARRRRAYGVIRAAAAEVIKVRLPARADNAEVPPFARISIGTILDASASLISGTTPAERRELEAIAREIVTWSVDETDREWARILGRPVPPAAGLDPLATRSRLRAFYLANEEALDAIGADLFADVRERLWTEEGLDVDAVARLLVERYAVTESKARFYAEDQALKMQGDIDRQRHEALGFVAYYWRTVGDDRVRTTHRAREGELFRWDDPPEGGHPSEDWGCRCYAEPQLDELEGALSALPAPTFEPARWLEAAFEGIGPQPASLA